MTLNPCKIVAIILFATNVYAQEVLTEYSEESLPVLNNELRRITNSYIDKNANVTIYGTKTFDVAPIVATSATVTSVINKGYVDGTWTNYGASSTVVGWSSFVSKNIYVKKIGTTVFVQYYIEGTSNSTSITFTLPYTQQSIVDLPLTAPCSATNSGTLAAYPGHIILPTGSSTVTAYLGYDLGTWTNSGTKIINGEFFYMTN